MVTRSGTTRWVSATTPDHLAVALATSERHGHGIYLGASLDSAPDLAPLFAPAQQAVLLLGPPRSGKTSSVVVPNVLAACGPVIAASTKADVLAATCAARSRVGPVLLFDPSGSVPVPPGVERVAWSPLGLADSWDGAVLVADSMVQAARPGTDRGEASHWSERAGALLSIFFHAGALEQRPMSKVIADIDRHDPAETRAALARRGSERALDVLEGILDTDGREQSGIWSTSSGVLAAYRTSAALASTEGRRLDPAQLLDSRGTLYVCAGSDHQRHAAPLVAGLLREVRTAVYQRSQSATAGTSGDPLAAVTTAVGALPPAAPLLLVLDELANIAPLHDLPKLIAEGGSQGVVTLACLQDLAQARARWEREADGFFSLFGTKLVFPGIGDTRTLEAVSLLAGEHDVPTLSVAHGGRRIGPFRARGGTTRTVSLRKERWLPVDAIARGYDGCILGIEGARPRFLAMTPWHSTSPWREAVIEARSRARDRHGLAVAAGPPPPALSSGRVRSPRWR